MQTTTDAQLLDAYRLWWNTKIRETLLDHQAQLGHQAGSWSPDGDQTGAGRVYTTALAALCLEVYHRYGEDLQSFGAVLGSDKRK
jgi:hypothetical protein